VALAAVRAADVVGILLPSYSPDFNPVENVFSVRSSWLKRWSFPDQYIAWPMLTVNSMLEPITGDMWRGFVRVAVRSYKAYVP